MIIPLILHALEQVLPATRPTARGVWRGRPGANADAPRAPSRLRLVLLDLTLPGARGLDLLAELRRRPLLPIVVLSATHDRATVWALRSPPARAASSPRRQSPRQAPRRHREQCSPGGRHHRPTLGAARVDQEACRSTRWASRSGNRMRPPACWCRANPTSSSVAIYGYRRYSQGSRQRHSQALNVHSRSQAIVGARPPRHHGRARDAS